MFVFAGIINRIYSQKYKLLQHIIWEMGFRGGGEEGCGGEVDVIMAFV